MRILGGLALAGVGFFVILGHRGELSGATFYLERTSWSWVLVGAALEALSFFAFMSMQRELLVAGQVPLRRSSIMAVTLAGNSIANSLPAGTAFGAAYTFRQFEQRGAGAAVALWTVLATNLLASSSLGLLALGGLLVAGPVGSVPGVLGVVIGLLVAVGVVTFLLHHGGLVRQRGLVGKAAIGVLGVTRRFTGWPRDDPRAMVERFLEAAATIRPGWRRTGAGAAWGLGNWVFDCACLATSFRAVGAGVPWQGLLIAYTAGQLAATLPITPGGLGVVEGSLTIALVAYGGGDTSTVAAVLIYRLLSFWLVLALGWLAWIAIAARARRSRPAMLKPAAEVEAG
ncbi:MAG: lysylphosphatidylglycerol synthase transmembrane domain-containing protein [Acidimicrobiales bacterium]